eukprot:1848403-Rhodomonas_salina.3
MSGTREPAFRRGARKGRREGRRDKGRERGNEGEKGGIKGGTERRKEGRSEEGGVILGSSSICQLLAVGIEEVFGDELNGRVDAVSTKDVTAVPDQASGDDRYEAW